jgi:hypothetical protein
MLSAFSSLINFESAIKGNPEDTHSMKHFTFTFNGGRNERSRNVRVRAWDEWGNRYSSSDWVQ